MFSTLRTKNVVLTLICCLVLGVVLLGTVVRSHLASAASVTASQSHTVSSTNSDLANTAAFRVTSITQSVTPSTVSIWTCGSSIQVVYNAVFHFAPHSKGGTLVFHYSINNGRAEGPEGKLTILPGQIQSNFTFTWQGSLPSNHFYPEPGGVVVASPNIINSPTIGPAGSCR